MDGGPSNGHSGDGAERGEEKAFGEELTDEAGARCAEGGADGGFAEALAGAGHEEVGDVGAADEEDEGDSAEEEQEGAANFADVVGLEGKRQRRKSAMAARPSRALISGGRCCQFSPGRAAGSPPLRRRPMTCRKAGPCGSPGPMGMDVEDFGLGGTLASSGKRRRKLCGENADDGGFVSGQSGRSCR